MAPQEKKQRRKRKLTSTSTEPLASASRSEVSSQDETKIKNEIDVKPEINSDFINPEKKQKKSGILYFPSIPPGFNVTKLRDELDALSRGNPSKTTKNITNESDGARKKIPIRYIEGWAEFKKKNVAKKLANSLNGSLIQLPDRRHQANGTMWLCKYLPGFKWIHLTEQLDYEKKVNIQRMKIELSQVKRIADHFAEQVEKGRNLRKLEEKVLRKGGLWNKYQRQIEQRKPHEKQRRIKKTNVEPNDTQKQEELLQLIFTE